MAKGRCGIAFFEIEAGEFEVGRRAPSEVP